MDWNTIARWLCGSYGSFARSNETLFTGGKPERLKGDLAGCTSRRINQEHRLVYAVQADRIRILSCRHHD